MESHYRSVVKAVSYRVVGTFITGMIVWAVTGKATAGAAVSIIDTAVKLGVYYVHERAWNRARMGRVQPPEYEI